MKFQSNRNHKRSKRQSRRLMKIRSMKYKILLHRKNKQDVFVKKGKHRFPVHSTNYNSKNFHVGTRAVCDVTGRETAIFFFSTKMVNQTSKWF